MANDSIRRLVGIDFGTSTSLVRTKRYQGDQPIGDSYSVSAVTYGNGAADAKAVTLVRHNPNGTFTCGSYGKEELEGSTVYREFKMDLESPDLRKQNLAKELTGVYFKYLFERYDHQKTDLGQLTDEVRTIISYPAKWRAETRAFMEAVATDAGFPNVTSMDEPSAALYAVLCRKMDDLAQQDLLTEGQPGYVLLVDMGAGTTDLAVCRYEISETGASAIAAERIKTEIIATWPDHSSDLTFGGREVDRILEDYLIGYLRDCGFKEETAQRAVRGVAGVKAWKEETVSLLLSQNQTVNTCSTVSQYTMLAPDPKPFPAFDREKFQQMLGEKLEDFKKLITDCLSMASEQDSDLAARGIDLVVLTGGHSSWYFTSELLDGTMPGIGHPMLEKVRQEKNRVLRLTNPQETVALGMVYSQLPFQIEKKIEEPGAEEPGPEIEPGGGEDIPAESASIMEFITGYRFGTVTPVYEGLLPMLMQNMGIPMEDRIYRAFDFTIIGSCKNGTVFTDKGIYCRPILGNTSFCSWKELGESLLRFSGGIIYAHNQDSHIEKEIGFFTVMGEEIKSFYRQLKACAREEFCRNTGGQAVHYGAVDYEKILGAVLSGFNAGTIAMITGKSVASAMRVQLRIPPEERIYLTHEDSRLTWLHGVMLGTVLTGSGIFTKTDAANVTYVSWQEFMVGTIEPTGGDIMLGLPDGSRKVAGKFGLCKPQAMMLYLELQKAFRAAAGNGGAVQTDRDLTPVQKFLEIFDHSGMQEILSAAYVPALRKEAEPHIGQVYLAHKSFVDGDGSRTWFWFAVGEKGIYTDQKKMITWDEFMAGDVVLVEGFKKRIPITGFPEAMLYENNFVHCYTGDLHIPSNDTLSQTVLSVFFAELKKYLTDPESYRVERYDWTPARKQALYAYVSQNPYGSMLQPYSGDPLLREFLQCPTGSYTLFENHNGKMKSIFASAACVDDEGFRRRRFKGGQVYVTSHETFLSNPVWVMATGVGGIFFAGTHYLFEALGKPEQVDQTLWYLKNLQTYLRNAK